jgi:hypothetical protein
LYQTFRYASAFKQELCWDTSNKNTYKMFSGSQGSNNPSAAKCACVAGLFYDGTACATCDEGTI